MTTALSQDETRLLNESLMEKLESDDPVMHKRAADALTEFTRYKMREDGITRRILPPVPVQNSDLTRSVEHEKPEVVVDIETDSPAAISLPFATLPDSYYLHGRRYKITLHRIVGPRWTKDVDELRTWQMDLRQVVSDNAIRDMLAEEDSKFLSACNLAVGTKGVATPTAGSVQYEEIPGGITREALAESTKVLPSTASLLEAQTGLVNHITIKDIMKWGRNEMGGDMSQDFMRDGVSLQNFMKLNWVVTIKRALVATNEVYHFADPKFLGKFLVMEDVVMYVRKEFFMVEFFPYELVGGAIGNVNSVARILFS